MAKTSKKSVKVATKAATKPGRLTKVAKKATQRRGSEPATKSKATKPVKLLSGGNPQIAKGYGNEPVQAYIAAMPGWKGDVGRLLDELVQRTVPNVYKAVKWNTPFYGFEADADGKGGWFLGFHCMTKYIKVAFFRGAALRPIPPVESKQKEVRYFHIHEGDEIDEGQLSAWVKQASQLPLERM